jgi:hypothetical protein
MSRVKDNSLKQAPKVNPLSPLHYGLQYSPRRLVVMRVGLWLNVELGGRDR